MVSPKRLQLLGFFFSVIFLAGCGELALPDKESLLFPGFQRSEVVGFVAGFGTTFAALPDLIAMLKRRSSKGMNPRMAAIMGAFQILWVYYGLLIASRPVILWNIIAVATNFIQRGRIFLLRPPRALTCTSRKMRHAAPMPINYSERLWERMNALEAGRSFSTNLHNRRFDLARLLYATETMEPAIRIEWTTWG